MPERKKIERCLFLFPPSRVGKEAYSACMPALGAAYLAAYIRNRYEVRILDATVEGFEQTTPLENNFLLQGLSIETTVQRILDYDPDFLGITCLFSTSFPVIESIIKRVKQQKPEIITCVGGTYPTFLADTCLQNETLDFIVLGEGELTLTDLLEALETGKPFGDIDGLAFRDANGAVRVIPRKQYVFDLDSLPYPARDLLPMDKYFAVNRPQSLTSRTSRQTSLLTSRGCPARCVFCSSCNFWGHHFRTHSAKRVLDEMEHLIKTYHVEEIQFVDDSLTIDKRRAKAIFQGMIDRKFNIKWSMPNGVAIWTLDEEIAELMKASGCYELGFAFESGSQEVLDNIIHKPVDLKHARHMVRVMKRLGIGVYGPFIIGFPGETPEQIKETFAYARKLDLDHAYFYVATPLPGTELYAISKEKGLLPDKFDFTNLNLSRATIRTEYFSPEEIEKLAVKEFLKYHLSILMKHPIRFVKSNYSVLKKPSYLFKVISVVLNKTLRSVLRLKR